jgi:hypothetical protein
LPGSFGESKNVEYLEKEKIIKSVLKTTENNSDRSQSQSRSSSSDKNHQHLRSNNSSNSYRRLGIVSMPPPSAASEKPEEQITSKPARRISLDDLSAAFQGLNGLRKTSPGTSGNNSAMSPKPRQPHVDNSVHHHIEYQSDDSMLEDHQRAPGEASSSRSASQPPQLQQQQRRSKSEESLLDRADIHYLPGGGSCCSSSACSRRNSPLSHSSSAHQHLGQPRGSATPPVVLGRSSFLRERSFVKEDSPTSLASKSRIPVPVSSSSRDGTDKAGGLDQHRYVSSNMDASTARAEYHPSSYAMSSGRYEPVVHTTAARYTSPYISPYTPPSSSHHISSYSSMLHDRPDHSNSSSSAYTTNAYRPTSAKEYNTRYNYYSSVTDPEAAPSTYLSGGSSSGGGGSTSPCWRRRSYDHDSDFVRYQRRSRPLSDYPTSSAAMTNSAGSTASAAALTRSRSRSRVSEYDAYRGSGDGSYLVGAYTSRPGAGYLYGHSYYHDSSDDSGRHSTATVRHPRPPDYPPLSAEVSGRTRRYQPDK